MYPETKLVLAGTGVLTLLFSPRFAVSLAERYAADPIATAIAWGGAAVCLLAFAWIWAAVRVRPVEEE